MTGITDPAEAYFKDGIWGFHSGAWQKLAMVWGFSSQYLEKQADTVQGAGARTLPFTTCPVGVARVILGFSAYDNTTLVDRIVLEVVTGGVTYVVHQGVLVPINQTVDMPVPLVLVNPNVPTVIFVGCGAGDTVIANAWGYDMALGA